MGYGGFFVVRTDLPKHSLTVPELGLLSSSNHYACLCLGRVHRLHCGRGRADYGALSFCSLPKRSAPQFARNQQGRVRLGNSVRILGLQ